MKKIILIGLSVLAMSSQANVEKCAIMVVGMQAVDVITALDVDRVVRNAGLNTKEMEECRTLIDTPNDALKIAITALIKSGSSETTK